jgi:spermidine synthase
MYKYDGLVIYQNHDDEGILEVVEQKGIRSLHFGSSSRQSSIRLDDPESLQLPYARAITSCLLFNPQIDENLIVGLGGGSLVRYLLHHFPECRIRSVEYRSSVVKIARSHFGLPLDSRLKIIVDDGAKYVKHQANHEADLYSLIIIDAFDVDGLAGSINSMAFFDACKLLLKPDGMLLVNLWATEKAVSSTCVKWLRSIFNDKVLLLPVRSRGNVIAIAFNQGTPRYDLKTLKSRSVELEIKYGIEHPLFLKDLLKNNPYTIHSVVN